jgi:hypothetical protein
MHSASATLPSGLYLLATTVADPGECEPIRDTLRGLLVGRTPRLHWRDQTPRRRRFIAGVLADLAVTHTVVVGMPLDQARQERARRQCMERLFHELHALAVVRVWIEARTASLNNRDQTMIAALRSRHVLPDSLTFDFARRFRSRCSGSLTRSPAQSGCTTGRTTTVRISRSRTGSPSTRSGWTDKRQGRVPRRRGSLGPFFTNPLGAVQA